MYFDCGGGNAVAKSEKVHRDVIYPNSGYWNRASSLESIISRFIESLFGEMFVAYLPRAWVREVHMGDLRKREAQGSDGELWFFDSEAYLSALE